MATRKRAPSKGSPKIRFVQIAAAAGPRGRSLYALAENGQLYSYLGLGRWYVVPVRELVTRDPRSNQDITPVPENDR